MVSSSQQDQPETHGDDQSDLEVCMSYTVVLLVWVGLPAIGQGA